MSTRIGIRWMEMTGVMAALGGAVDCSNSSSPPAGSNDGGANEASSAQDSGTAADAGGVEATLTVMNFLSWCSVSINGGATSSAATVTTSVPTGAITTITITPASSAFEIGADPWFGVTQNDGGAAPGIDVGSGVTETSTATVFVSANQCVSVCCEEPNNSPTPCPTTNSCP